MKTKSLYPENSPSPNVWVELDDGEGVTLGIERGPKFCEPGDVWIGITPKEARKVARWLLEAAEKAGKQ